MGYLDFTDAELIALTRQKRREAHDARLALSPPTLRFRVQTTDRGQWAFIADRWEKAVASARRALRYMKPPRRSHTLLPESIFRTLWKLQGGRCYLCPKAFTEDDWATREHVIPRALGGEDGGNILLACAACNNRKADRAPMACEMLYLRHVNDRFAEVWEPA